MLKGFFEIKKLSRDLAIAGVAIYMMIWCMGRLKEIFDPHAFNEAWDAKIHQSEERTKQLVLSEVAKESTIREAQGKAVLTVVKGIDSKLDILLKRELSMPQRSDTATLMMPVKAVN